MNELLVEPAHHQPGYRAILVGPVPQRQVVIERAADVAAAAALLGVPVRSSAADVRAACRIAGVALADAPVVLEQRAANLVDQLVSAARAVVDQAEPGGWSRAVDTDLVEALREALGALRGRRLAVLSEVD